MNKVVRAHYPIEKLPADLRSTFGPEDQVTVTVEQEAAPETSVSLDDIYAMADNSHLSRSEIDEHLRTLRDEWER